MLSFLYQNTDVIEAIEGLRNMKYFWQGQPDTLFWNCAREDRQSRGSRAG